MLQIKLLSKDAIMPQKATQGSAGYDLFSTQDILIPSHEKQLISTGISIVLPKESYGRIAPRSGLASKNFIDVGAGVIDRDYRGEVKVLLFNFSKEEYNVKKGDRIAQLIIERIFELDVQEIEQFDDTSERGDKGFGSSGIQQFTIQ